MSAEPFRYWGFISYSHRDRRWGEWLHRALESYRVPRRLVGSQGAHGPVPARVYPIFRDRDELSTGAHLTDVLIGAIDSSRFFIVICSPNSATSRWVDEEIRHVKKSGRADRILCLIVDGEPYASDKGQPERECFPPALREDYDADGTVIGRASEPMAADLRDEADGRDDARLRLLAGLLGVRFDELRQRDLRARMRRMTLLSAGAVVLAVAMVALAVRAVIAERLAEQTRQQGEDLIGFMLGDMRSRLEPLGKLDILDSIGDHAMGYLARLDSRQVGESALAARAKALRQIGDVRFQQGRSADAATAFDAALALNRQLAERHPQDAELQFELGQAEFWVGYAAWAAKQLDRAAAHFESYLHISQGLVDRDPGNARWQTEVTYAIGNLGALAFSRNDFETALQDFRDQSARYAASEPLSEDTQNDLAKAYSWQGTTLQMLGRPREAVAILLAQTEILGKLSAARPDDRKRSYELAEALSALGFAGLAAADNAAARGATDQGRRLVEALIANDGSNREYRFLAANFAFFDAGLAAVADDRTRAEAALSRSLATLEQLRSLDRDNSQTLDRLIDALSLRHALALLAKDSVTAHRAAEAALGLCRERQSAAVAAQADHCIRAGLLMRELEPSTNDPALSRAALSSGIDRLEASGAAVFARQLRARLLLLDGDSAAAAAALRPLMARGYLSPELRLFLDRHCVTDIARLPGLGCRVVSDKTH